MPFRKADTTSTPRVIAAVATCLALGMIPSKASASDPFAYVRSNYVDSVLYRANDFHIHEIAVPPGGSAWHTGDLNALTNSPSAAGNPAAYVTSDYLNSVVYRGFDNHIHEIATAPGNSNVLAARDLSLAGGAPPAAGNPVGYVRSDYVNAVVYRGTDGHIHELYRMPGTTIWRAGDLSALTGAPIAAGDPAPFIRSDRVNSVVYRGADGHIHELYLRFGTNSWGKGDLSGLTGAPAAAGDPAGFVRSDKVNSVVYRATDGHIRELYLRFGAGAWGTGTSRRSPALRLPRAIPWVMSVSTM